MGKKLGDWYSPSIICHVLHELIETDEQEALGSVVFRDRIIYKEDILKASGALQVRKTCLCPEGPTEQNSD
jgi:hypothetical protein